MSDLSGRPTHASGRISRQRRILIVVAIASAVVGVAIWNFGYVVQFGSASRYPVEIATIAGYFIGLALNLGIPLVAYSLFKETKQTFSQLARTN